MALDDNGSDAGYMDHTTASVEKSDAGSRTTDQYPANEIVSEHKSLDEKSEAIATLQPKELDHVPVHLLHQHNQTTLETENTTPQQPAYK